MYWLSIFWILNHLLSAMLIVLGIQKRVYSIFAIGILQVVLIFSKPISYDLNHYFDYFSDPNYSFEFGFSFLSMLVNFLTRGNALLSLWVVQNIGVVLFIYFVGRVHGVILKSKLTYVDYIKLTVAFSITLFYFMGSQNVLRQFIAITIVGYSFLSIYQGNKMRCAIFMILSVLFHFGTVIFVAFSLSYFAFRKYRYSVSLPLLFFGGGLMALVLNVIYPELEYLITGFATGDERTGAPLKAVIYFLLIIFSFLIISRSIQVKELLVSVVLKLRFFLFFFSLPLVFLGLDEFYSRVIFPLFFFDAILICRSFLRGASQLYNYSSAVLVASYAFAPNALNLLGA